MTVNKGKNIMKIFIFIILSTTTFCLADQRHFVWTYEYKTVNKSEIEIEHYYTTSYPNTSDLSKNIKKLTQTLFF